MNIKITTFIILILTFLSTIAYSQIKKTAAPELNDSYNYIAINNCKMWVSNNGSGSFNPYLPSGGFLWPGGESATKNLIFEDGLIWGGIVDSQIVVNGNTHRGHLRPGKILPDGIPDDSSLSKYRVFKIRKDWEELPEGSARDGYERDYYEWPLDDGAPFQDLDNNGKYTPGKDKPDFIGDEVLWYVSNDLDTNYSLTTLRPLGLEIQTTVFAFNKQDSFADIIFKQYKIINKGKHNIKDMYFGYWSDPDLGDASDDFCGCDTVLNIGYAYNSRPIDAIYGQQPPAIGYEIINTSPKLSGNKILTSFNIFMSNGGSYRDPLSVTEYYNALQGKFINGNNYRNPLTGRITKYCVPGDPLMQTGWYEGSGWPNGPSAGDRRMILSAGPFNVSPNDTIKIVLAIIVGNGYNYYLSNIWDLKTKASDAKIIYEKNFETVKPPASPVMHYYPMNREVKLWWEKDAEEVEYPDPFYNLAENPIPEYYKFEGYRLWQYKDKNGTDPQLLTVFDIQNNVSLIYDQVLINGYYTEAPVISGTNNGLQRDAIVSSDYFNNYTPLNNYSPYYFGVTAYYYNPHLYPTYLESKHNPLEVIPGQERIDQTYPLRDNDVLTAKQVNGNSDAVIKFNVIDPTALTSDIYQVKFSEINNNLYYSLYDKTKGTALLESKNDFTKDLNNKPIVDGFILTVENTGKDSITAENTKYRVKDVLEVKGKDRIDLAEPIDVINNLNSTNKWQIKVKGNFNRLNWQEKTADEGLGYDDYELRFTGSSQYYVSGRAFSFNPILRDDPLAKNTLPFEAWCIGRNIDSTQYYYRLTLKVWDFDRHDSTRTIPDSIWTQLDNNDWEEIYAYKSAFDPANLPPTSGNSKFTDHKFGGLCISGDIPDPGTVIRILTYKPLKDGDIFEAKLEAANLNDKDAAKENLDKISVFPNPFFGTNNITNLQQNFIRFISVPKEVTIRIYNLAGVFIRKLVKNDLSSYIDWDLQNENCERVGSGIYIAYLDMPGIGKKYIKIAIIQQKKYLERY